ncbi:MAG: S8 family serine peptidase [Pyrinomonadaceae bacterium]|nr:S8 family serine peptidase [Pyrinomonadaceae bacterium]
MTSRNPRSHSRIYLYSGILMICLVGLMQSVTTTSSSRSLNQKVNTSEKVGAPVLAATANDNIVPIVILLSDQADLSAAYSIQDEDARGWFVYNTLTSHAARTQAGLQDFLQSRGGAFQSFWAANMIAATANRQLIEALAARPDVARIDSNTPTRWVEEPIVEKSGVAPESPAAIEWGVQNVNAPALWTLGFNGTGMVIGGLDTGIRWTHNVLKPKYRGWNGSVADHNYNWRDAIHSGGGVCGPNTVAPCDDSGHGTHTVGTVVGDDGGTNQVGVAPGAKWMGCRNMNQGDGTPATYTECFQFAIAPTNLAGNNPNPSLRPHVLNNSWGCPASEGCTSRAELETIVNNTQAAGIFVAVSAGNGGPGCATVADPASIYSASFSVGAIDSSNTLAGFSSRGPSTFYAPNLLKPNISAPGVNVRSATRNSDNAFSSSSGTSMAGPHVAGVVALIWSARPHLVRNIAATRTLLQNTANPMVSVVPQTCAGISSSQIPNNSFGYGRVDALAAFNASAPATISGTVTAPDGSPVAGVTVRLSGATTTKTITDNNGFYHFDNLATQSSYTVTPERVNYTFSPGNLSFALNGNRTDAAFTATPDATISANPIDTAEYFVRQHYLDFLGREPDSSGFNFWSDQVTSCGADAGCIERRRINVSAAYFLSVEFQETGYLVYRIYKSAYGNISGAPVPVRFDEFLPDTQQIGQGVVVGVGNWQTQLENNKQAFAAAFVARSRFTTAFPTSRSPTEFVDALYANAVVTPSAVERNSVIAEFGSATTTTDTAARARALRRVAENAALAQQEFSRAFVLMQYFGYLRRNPNDPPEPGLNFDGYNFWLNKLIQFNGNYIDAEMVKAFITSSEYRVRFPR